MKTSTFSLNKLAHTAFLMFLVACSFNINAFGQISLNNEAGEANPKSKKLKREAARYKAEGVKESHLDMKNFSYKKGQPGKREEGELAYDEIYNAPSPVKEERVRFFKRKK